MARRPSAISRFHIDVPLLFLLLALTAYGLFVLYSASGQDMGAVIRQGRYFLLAYAIMFLVAQISMQRLCAGHPGSTWWRWVRWLP